MPCPKCNNPNVTSFNEKSEMYKGKREFRCLKCGYHYRRDFKGNPTEIKDEIKTT